MATKNPSHQSKVIVSSREGHSARAAALEAIADLNETIAQDDDPDFDPSVTHDPEQDVAKDLNAEGDDTGSQGEPPEEEAEQPPVTEPASEEPEGEPPAPAIKEPSARKFKIKVNGKDLELTEDELIARAQKVESADQYLAEAARVRHETNQERVGTRQPANVPAARPSDEEDAALARAMQVGTEEEAVAAIRRLRESASANADRVASTVDERIGFLKAVDNFSQNYADIVGDPVLSSIAFALDKQLMENGDKRPYGERYREIGDLLRGKVRAWAEQYGAGNAQKTQEKTERKRQAPSAPASAGAKASASTADDDEDGPEDYSRYIRQEAERRGKHYGVQ